jgi:hypothetical protein
MDRDRDDDERRLIPRGRGRGSSSSGRDDRAGEKFDPAEWDKPADPPPPSPAARARSEADAAQAFGMFSGIDTGIQRLLANFGLLRDLVSDVRASVADAAAQDAERAEANKIRDDAIAARLIDPERLGAYAGVGARQGVKDAIGETVADMKRQIAADMEARDLLSKQFAADLADRRAHETRRRRQDGWRNGALAVFALLVPVALGCGYHLGNEAGDASGYARSRDEVAAASWANTPNGKIARALDQADHSTLPMIAECSGKGWTKDKRDGRRVCFGGGGGVSGWYRP